MRAGHIASSSDAQCSRKRNEALETGSPSLFGVQVVYSFEVGGSETLALRLAEALDEPSARWGLVAARSAAGPISAEASRLGLSSTWLDLEAVGRFRRLRPLLRLAAWLRARKVQVAHVHHLLSLRDTYPALRLGGVQRIILTEHSAEPFERVRYLPAIWRVYDRLVDAVTVVSDDIQRQVRQFVPAARPPIVIRNGVDASYFMPRPAKDNPLGDTMVKTVGWLGRLHPHKDVCTGIRAFAHARSKRGSSGHLRMLIGGAGTELERARRLVDDLGLAEVVEFRGHVHDTRAFLQSIDVLLISSITEGLPLVMLEAMSSGVPVVATDVGGIGEALSDGGRLCRSGDEADIADKLVAVLESPELAQQLGHCGRQRVLERYSMDSVVAQYQSLYSDVSSRTADEQVAGG